MPLAISLARKPRTICPERRRERARKRETLPPPGVAVGAATASKNGCANHGQLPSFVAGSKAWPEAQAAICFRKLARGEKFSTCRELIRGHLIAFSVSAQQSRCPLEPRHSAPLALHHLINAMHRRLLEISQLMETAPDCALSAPRPIDSRSAVRPKKSNCLGDFIGDSNIRSVQVHIVSKSEISASNHRGFPRSDATSLSNIRQTVVVALHFSRTFELAAPVFSRWLVPAGKQRLRKNKPESDTVSRFLLQYAARAPRSLPAQSLRSE